MVLIIATLIVRSRIGQTLLAIRQNEGLVGAIGIALRLCQIAPRDLRDRYLPALLSGQVSACAALTEPGQSFGATRHSFGKPLNAIPSWQAHLADAVAAPDASTAVTAKAVALVTNGEDAQLAAAEAKIVAVTAAQTHLPQVLQLMGAEGLRPEHPFTRRRCPARNPAGPLPRNTLGHEMPTQP